MAFHRGFEVPFKPNAFYLQMYPSQTSLDAALKCFWKLLLNIHFFMSPVPLTRGVRRGSEVHLDTVFSSPTGCPAS